MRRALKLMRLEEIFSYAFDHEEALNLLEERGREASTAVSLAETALTKNNSLARRNRRCERR